MGASVETSGTTAAIPGNVGGFAPGMLLGPYRILRRIGVGGMGVVYEAEHTMLRQRFAVKALTLKGENVAVRRESAARFLLEARVTSRMRHAGIVAVQTLEVDDQTGTLYFVMEYVAMPSARRDALVASALGDATVWRTPAPPPEAEGQVSLSLEDLLQASKARGRRLNPTLVRRLLLDVCSALAYAHGFGEGVLHRDIKPANILVRPGGRAVMADFGVAKVLGEAFRKEVLRHQGRSLSLRIEADGRLSRVAPGTEHYLTPELLAGGEPTPKADLYALGVTAYQLLTGKLFSADSVAPSALGLPRAWDRLILGCLRADPAKRWASVAAFRRALAALPGREAMASFRRVALWGTATLAVGALGAGVTWGTLGREVAPEAHPPAEGLWVPRERPGLFLRFERVPGGFRLVRVHPDYCGHLTLAERYRGQPLVAVRERAFQRCGHLTGVSAPRGVALPSLGGAEAPSAAVASPAMPSPAREVPLEGCPGAFGRVRQMADGTHRLVGVRGLREGCGFTLPSEIARVAKGAFAGCPRGLRIRLARADVFFEPDAFGKVSPAVIAFPMGQPPLFTRRSFPWVPAFWEDGAEVRLLWDVGDVRYLRAHGGVYVYAVRDVREGATLTLPAHVGSRPVLGVLPHAFMGQAGLRRVVVEGASVRLWPDAFEGMGALEEIVTDADVSEEALRAESGSTALAVRRLGEEPKGR